MPNQTIFQGHSNGMKKHKEAFEPSQPGSLRDLSCPSKYLQEPTPGSKKVQVMGTEHVVEWKPEALAELTPISLSSQENGWAERLPRPLSTGMR